MALTKDFRETVKERADRDPEFRKGLLTEAMDAFVQGEPNVAKILLRDYINATVGFAAVASAIGKDPKSVMRMLSPTGNPGINSLLGVTRYLQTDAGLQFRATSEVSKPKKRKGARRSRAAASEV